MKKLVHLHEVKPKYCDVIQKALAFIDDLPCIMDKSEIFSAFISEAMFDQNIDVTFDDAETKRKPV